MRATLMGELAGEPFEVIWDDGRVRGTARLIERLGTLNGQGDSGDPLAFIHRVERAIGTRPALVVWPDAEADADGVRP